MSSLFISLPQDSFVRQPYQISVLVGRWGLLVTRTAILSRHSAATPNRRFEFDKRGQLFIRTHNETLSIVAMCISNEDCPPARIHA